jgi:ATPase family associated with various cellular activities (AAA)
MPPRTASRPRVTSVLSSSAGFIPILRASERIAEALRILRDGARPELPLFVDEDFAGTPIEEFVTRLELSAFERDALLMLAGMNLSMDLSMAVQMATGGAQPHFALMLSAFAEHQQLEQLRIAPDAPLRRWKLVQFADPLQNQPLNLRALVLDEWVFLALLGHTDPDEVLLRLVQPLQMPRLAFSEAQSNLVARGATTDEVLLQISGSETELRRHVAHGIAARLERPLYALDAAQLELTQVEDVAVRWNRFARLSDALLLIEVADLSVGESATDDPKLRAARALASRIESAVIVSTRSPLSWGRASLTLEIARPSSSEQRALWNSRLEVAGVRRNATLERGVERLVGQFDFTGSLIERATAEALGHVDDPRDAAALSASLWDASLSLVRPRLEGLTQRIVPAERADWSRLILPEHDLNTLKRLVAHVRERQHVYETWGWQQDSTRGFGISALFGGPSGTGKTFSAEIIAKELGVDLQRIELPSIVSKYIGESEKLLSKLFDAAEYGGCILLFDEADAIFGKRSEVKDSNDRYANLEVSYLLQRMESFRGLVILTTNQESNMDTAFLRRLRFVVHYPSPEPEARAALWRGIFPRDTPTEGLNYARLAQLEVAGGNIRNIALNAAFNASSEGSPVRMRHIHASALEEVRKLKRLPRSGEFDGWGD